jgi:hypothetical protein
MPVRFVLIAAGLFGITAEATEVWSQPAVTGTWSAPPKTEQWSTPPATGTWSSPPRPEAQPAPDAPPATGQWALPTTTERRGGCAADAAAGREVYVKWYGLVEPARVAGTRQDGALCVVYQNTSLGSEWIEAGRLATREAYEARKIPAANGGDGAGSDAAARQMEQLRETQQQLHRETDRQWQETERHYEDRRRYGP